MINFGANPLALAPLAGFTDLPFRSLVKSFGADITFSEMISANALIRNSSKTYKMLEHLELETPFIVQIAGSDIDVIKQAVLILNDMDRIDGIDLNCGCPVPKVVAQNSGSNLLKDLPLLSNLLECIKKYSNKRYTSVKIRLGFSEKYPEKIVLSVHDRVDFISIHGRTRSGGYSSKVDYEAIKNAKQCSKVPVFANGDITSFQKAKEVKELTKCEGLMIGRGAIGNPWIFHQIKTNSSEVSKSLKKQIVFKHLDEMIKFYGDKGLVIFRKHLHNYSKGYENATEFRNMINRIEQEESLRNAMRDFFS